MAEKILILGNTGSGKSHAVKYLNPKETFIICPDEKTLPFRGAKKNYKSVYTEDGKLGKESNYYETTSMIDIHNFLLRINEKKPEIKNIIVDTITHAMIDSVMKRLEEDNWNKYKEYALELYDMIKIIPNMREDLTVIFTSHMDIDSDSKGNIRSAFKIPAGKLTKEAIVPEGKFTTVLGSEVILKDEKPVGYFITAGSPYKSPEGMFPETKIPNNYQYVIDCVKAYNNDEDPPKMPPFTVELD